MRTQGPNWKDDLIEFARKVMLAPIRVPAMMIGDVLLRAKARPLASGRIGRAWERCAAVWKECGLVCQAVGYAGPAFPHDLAVALARQHRQKELFLSKLSDPDPLLAAYALKCLIRACELRCEDLPPELFQRPEPIQVLHADMADQERLGAFFEGYFKEQEWLREQGRA
jgi:hypothetical protein